MMGRILALDLGTVRVGVAISDELGITAQPAGVFKRIGYKSDLREIRAYLRDYKIKRIVIGHPLNMDATRGEMAQSAEKFADKLKVDLPGISISLWDERWTTAEAERLMIAADVSRKKRRKVIDQAAAQLILTGWMAAHPQELG
jgi:putative Holliday junction resolvase